MTDTPITLDLKVEDITMDEMCLLEDALGAQAVKGMLEGEIGPKALRGLVWLALRRDNPEATLEDAGRVKMAALPSATPEQIAAARALAG